MDAIYDNPDAFTSEGEGIYETVYSESLQPSMFTKPPEKALEKEEEIRESTKDADKDEGEVLVDVEDVYAPIYSLPTSLESSGTVLQFKPENIHRIKTLGTGYFGKVLLADTVGLSLKELKMSETRASLCVLQSRQTRKAKETVLRQRAEVHVSIESPQCCPHPGGVYGGHTFHCDGVHGEGRS